MRFSFLSALIFGLAFAVLFWVGVIGAAWIIAHLI